MKFTTITALITAAIGLSSAEQPISKRQDDPYNINWSFLSAKEGDPFIQKGIHPDGLWHRVPSSQSFIGVLREGGADGDLARCFLNDLQVEVFHREFLSLPPVYGPGGARAFQICCFYERKSNGPIEPDPPRCCHSPECWFRTGQQ
ncbi:hypothetical protein ACJ41O_009199 [Fusarium nematophilum]